MMVTVPVELAEELRLTLIRAGHDAREANLNGAFRAVQRQVRALDVYVQDAREQDARTGGRW